ncbi:MAG: sensor histidine kinase [Opitutaceae bacterium]
MEWLDEQIEEEAKKLGRLAPLQPAKQIDQFGYHSDYIPAVDGLPEEPLWTMDFDIGIKNRRILGFVMVPTIDERSRELKGYAFPKRFRITLINARDLPEEVLVDWTSEDFPDPGMRPVLFNFPSQFEKGPVDVLRKGLRLEVFAGHEEDGLEFFSLGRVHMIRTAELQWVREIKVSSSFESAPYWGTDYLYSPRHTLGMPLLEQDTIGGNLILELPASKLKKPLTIRLLLEDKARLGWAHLLPGKNSGPLDVPGYGFPKTVQIYRLMKMPRRKGYLRIPVEDPIFPGNPGNNMVRLFCRGYEFFGLEIECNDFPLYQGQATFALGEIEMMYRGKNHAPESRVTIQHSGSDEDLDLGVLVDGRVGGQQIIPMIDWMQQLAAGKMNANRLSILKTEYQQLSERWQKLQKQGMLGLLALVAIAGGAFVLLLLRSRRQATLRLRQQISSDLHDDIGSKIAAISLASQDVALHAKEERMRKRGLWIGSVASTMHEGLRDVLWLTNDQTDTLAMLVQKLGETARKSVPESQLQLRISETSQLPGRSIPLQSKRDILFFAKEALHNATSHADATLIKVFVTAKQHRLSLSITDNGRGFKVPTEEEVNKNVDHIGLRTLRERARRVSGVYQLSSTLGQGTSVELTVKL